MCGWICGIVASVFVRFWLFRAMTDLYRGREDVCRLPTSSRLRLNSVANLLFLCCHVALGSGSSTPLIVGFFSYRWMVCFVLFFNLLCLNPSRSEGFSPAVLEPVRSGIVFLWSIIFGKKLQPVKSPCGNRVSQHTYGDLDALLLY